MPALRKSLSLILSVLLTPLLIFSQMQESTFTKLEYAGGLASVPGSKNDTASMSVLADKVTLTTADQKSYSFAPSQVTQLAYARSQKVCRGCVIGGVLTLGLAGALFAFKKHKDHWITIALGQEGSLMIRAQKGNYKDLIQQLHEVTGKPIAIDPNEIGDIPSGIPTVAIN